MDAKTWASNPPEQYPLQLGKLLANIATLEMALRAVLYQQEAGDSARRPVAKGLTGLRVGQVLEESALTSWDSLRELIARYNKRNPDAAIADGICDLRDAFAHGRILTDDPASHLRLIRFSHPKDGSVTVEMAETLSPEWLGQQIHRVHDAVQIVHQRLRAADPPQV
jgi:hypothetical protein